ncbi:MAG: hypothetical protein PCALPYG88_2051 [uncultured Paraburkholderia sp.]|uniref:TnsA endonuclease C-terminal domain-containing protein n=1 Tax=uncultured Paraburkholderia sp. TaxID=1822466 RepID=UPI002599F362|nr:TnsA endonuclease C-terminal domain-containing protein [uncultured Paraburkholderia sp.]CAH2897748.1 MAG: hypothetical protein PCALPYG08_3044 [uncultured Paraburkholderia sp.]CAH2918614.1 MAG: hypothetical protein PCALPYG88_2051 [uncultured Paraburkholderia sp.]
MTSRTLRMRPSTRRRKLKEQEVARTEGRHERWIGTRDMPGVGIKTRLTSTKTDLREIHLLSAGEHAVFLELWWAKHVLTIYDQVWHESVKTRRAAAEIGVAHPSYPGSGDAVDLSTDLVAVTSRNGKLGRKAFSVKPASFSETGLTPKQRIEQQTWKNEGVEFEAVFTEGMHATRSKNLAWLLRAANDVAAHGVTRTEMVAQRELHRRLRRRCDVCVIDACRAVERSSGLPLGSGMRAFRQLAAARHIRFDLDAIEPAQIPVQYLSFSKL